MSRQGACGRPLHVLYLHQHFTVRDGTAGGRSHEFSRLLVANGHRVTMIAGAYDRSGLPVPERGVLSRLAVDGIDVLALKVPYHQSMSTVRRLLAFAQFVLLATWTALRVRGVDVIYATSTPLTTAIPAMVAALWHRRPFVFEVRDLWPAIPIQLGVLTNPLLKWLARRLESTAYHRARHVVALSPGMRDGVVATGIPGSAVTVIPNSSDVELFRVDPGEGQAFRDAHPELGDRPLVVYAGAMGRVNGLEYALDLAARVAALDSRIAFVLAGDGSEKQRLIELSNAANLTGRTVYFLDPLRRRDLARLLSAATVLSSFFIPLPLMQTNSANKFFDAFAAGRPIAINYGGWQADLLRESGAGLVLDHADVGAAAEALVRAVNDGGWLARASAASRQLGEEVFDRRRLAADLERVLVAAAEQ